MLEPCMQRFWLRATCTDRGPATPVNNACTAMSGYSEAERAEGERVMAEISERRMAMMVDLEKLQLEGFSLGEAIVILE